MTSHNSTRQSAITNATRLLVASADTVNQRALAQLIEELPAYARLPREQIMGEVLATSRMGISAFAHMVEAGPGSGLSPEHRAALAASAAQRAEEGVAMADVLRAYFVSVQTAFDYLEEILGEALHPAVTGLTRHSLEFLEAVTATVADGYAREHELTLGETLSARLQLGSALVEGSDHSTLSEAATFAGVELAPAYAVVALRVRTSRDRSEPRRGDDRSERSASPDPEVVHARLLRRLRTHLLSRLGKDVLWIPNYRDALLLVPLDTAGRGRHFSSASFDALLAGLDLGVLAGICQGTSVSSGVAAAARTAVEIRDLVTRLARPTGCYELSEVALELQISRPGVARQALAALVAPLADEPRLLATLDVFITENRHRLRTARRLAVHANTVDNRLKRIAVLTGLDPLRPRDMTRLEAATAAASLQA